MDERCGARSLDRGYKGGHTGSVKDANLTEGGVACCSGGQVRGVQTEERAAVASVRGPAGDCVLPGCPAPGQPPRACPCAPLHRLHAVGMAACADQGFKC